VPHIIEPHGSSALHALFVADSRENEQLQEEAERLPSIVVSSAAAAHALMLGGGYFNPLTGYMDKADALSVARDMKTTGGLFWPVPVLNLVKGAPGLAPGQRVALRDPNVVGAPVLAVMDIEAVETLTDEKADVIVHKVYRTADPKHPGVAAFVAQGRLKADGLVIHMLLGDAGAHENQLGSHARP
jgi:sulfate adenylyltransferase